MIRSYIKKICIFLSIRRHDIRADIEESGNLCFNNNQIGYFPLSANTIKIIKRDDNVLFCRQCKKHTSKVEYFKEELDTFFYLAKIGVSCDNFKQEIPIQTKFTKEYVCEFRKYLKSCALDAAFFDKISNTDKVINRIGFDIWHNLMELDDIILCELGMPRCPNKFYSVIPFFVTYIGGAAWTYRINRFLPKDYYESFNADRSIASYKIAELLGLSNLLVETHLMKIHVDGACELDVVCNQALGERAMDSKMEPSTVLQKNLTSLNLLDVLCYQKDHWLNNYNVYGGNDKAEFCCAFDNDNMWTFFIDPRISFKTQHSDSPIINSDGILNRAGVDYALAEKFLNTKTTNLLAAVSGYLTLIQKIALVIRFIRLKRMIRRTIISAPTMLKKNDSEWSATDFQKEISGYWGKTYLYMYANNK